MGSKGRQQTTESPSPATEAPAPGMSATPDQDTVGNAAVAERMKQAPKEPELSLLDAEGDWDMDGFNREMKIRILDVEFFKGDAGQFEQVRMLTAASKSQASDLLASVSTHEAKRLFGKVSVDQRLKIAEAAPYMIRALDVDLAVEFMFAAGTPALAQQLSPKQINALANAESEDHPKLARLFVLALPDQHQEAFDAMTYGECALYVLTLQKYSWC